MPKPTILVTRFLFLAFIFGACLRGDVITYVWQGNNGATGSFALDSAWFNDRPLDFVSESHLSAFFFDVGGYIFDLGMVSSAKYGIADIVFDSTVVGPPKYLDGSGIAATNTAAGALLSFFPGAIEAFSSSFTGENFSNSVGDFVATPEPRTWVLFAGELAFLALVSVKRSKRKKSGEITAGAHSAS